MTCGDWRLGLGASVVAGGVEFRVWAPGHEAVDVVVYGPAAEAVHPLAAEDDGWFRGVVADGGAGTRYKYRLDGGDVFPDPASRSQPDGVHGASEVVDPRAFPWTDVGWAGRPLEEMVIYELHVGTFTPQGTFDAAISRLDALVELGVTAIEPLPVASFPGDRNWGYDGVSLYAPDASYGGPEGLRRLVDAAHARGLAVVLDAVYNHLGPEGNYLHAFTGGQYFTSRHQTPWGDAVNFDGPGSAAVREFVIRNALHWACEHHVDGLRLDATHAIVDDSPEHVLAELRRRVRAALPPGRHFVFMAEDERNERRLVAPEDEDGLGLDAVWADDFHHQLRSLVAGDNESYYADYTGSIADLAETLRAGWYYQGQPSPNRGEPRGTVPRGVPPTAFVHCIQNHDQVGNRALGDRLTRDVDLPRYRTASALLLLSPYTPLLWMGQEWAATTPFLYFTDHPEELGRAVTEGRRKEFGKFSAFRDPALQASIPDPQAEETFRCSKLDWSERERMPHAGVVALYRELLALRRTHAALLPRGRDTFDVVELGDTALAILRTDGAEAVLLVCAFGGAGVTADLSRADLRPPEGRHWRLLLHTEEARFGGDAVGELAVLQPDGTLELRSAGAVVLVA